MPNAALERTRSVAGRHSVDPVCSPPADTHHPHASHSLRKFESDVELSRVSPSNLLVPSVTQLFYSVFSGAPFENLGSTVEVVVNGTATYNGTTYSLKQYHFHTPSEHRINGEYYPLEVRQTCAIDLVVHAHIRPQMHLVHQSSGGKILVIGILFDVDFAFTTSLVTSTILNLQSVRAPQLVVLFRDLTAERLQITTPGTQTKTGPLEFEEIIANIARGKLYQYTGSLTTPPCTEGVQWLVLATPQPLNVDSYNALKKVLKFNARYTQNTLGQTNVLQLHKC